METIPEPRIATLRFLCPRCRAGLSNASVYPLVELGLQGALSLLGEHTRCTCFYALDVGLGLARDALWCGF